MERFTKYLFLTLLLVVMNGCKNSEEYYSQLPDSITSFIVQYFPSSNIAIAHQTSDGGWAVQLENSYQMTFNKDNDWVTISGTGQFLPQVLLFDQLNPTLYKYLLGMDATEEVYSISRDSVQEKATLNKYYVVYNISDNTVKQYNFGTSDKWCV